MRNSLEPEIVGAALVTSGQPWRGVEFHPAIGSTNSRLRELLTGAAEGIGPDASRLGSADGALWWVVLTDHQTGGRGRLGRAWEVPDRASVAVSAAVPVGDGTAATNPSDAGNAADASGLGWLPLLAGLALARAITATTERSGHALSPRLKWPNDVLLPEDGDRKVSGILCELVDVPGPTPRRAVVVGTGVNVDQDRDELPVDTATSLALTGVRVRREDLVVSYLHELAAILGTGVGTGVGAGLGADGARDAYRQACSTLGQVVRVHLPVGEPVEGTAVAVDDTGALVVDTPSGRRAFAAGDVVHVRRP